MPQWYLQWCLPDWWRSVIGRLKHENENPDRRGENPPVTKTKLP
jgi:hypothetical protein